MTVMTVSAKDKKTSAFVEGGTYYVYGVSYSAADSIVYMTDLLMLEKVQLNKKTGFLINRHLVSAQLTKYLAGEGLPHRTSSITFNKSLNKVDKAYRKQVAQLKKRGFLIKYVDQTKFRFETVREEE